MSSLPKSESTRGRTKNGGQIEMILGPMFAGKTTELMRRILRYKHANYKCLLIKYSGDSRYNDSCLSTHDKRTLGAENDIKIEKVKYLKEVQNLSGCQVIGIDEGQFFSDIVEFSEKWANDGFRVIVAGLDGNYRREAFGSILSLIPLAESVVELKTVCMKCYGETAFTKRLGNNTEASGSILSPNPLAESVVKLNVVCMKCYGEAAFTKRLGNKTEVFGSILSLIPLAESVVKLNAVCMKCYGEAAFTKRLGDNKEIVVIGGSEKYKAVCRKCFQEEWQEN